MTLSFRSPDPAAKQGLIKTIEHLFQFPDANINAQDSYEMTALHYAAEFDRPQSKYDINCIASRAFDSIAAVLIAFNFISTVAKFLCKNGALLTLREENGNNAIGMAAICGSSKSLRVLYPYYREQGEQRSIRDHESTLNLFMIRYL
jgi:ankyrin repeat protein